MDLKTKIDLGGCNVYSAVQTAPELRDYVKRGKLWVTRASSCQLDLSLRFDTCDGSREGMKANLLDIFEACPIWQALGLQLRRDTKISRLEVGPDVIHTYYLQHVSEHSALVAPKDVPCVYLSTWHCELTFGARKPSTRDIGSEFLAPKKYSKIVTFKLPPRRLRRFAARKQRWNMVPTGPHEQQSGSKPKMAPLQSFADYAMVTEEAEFFSIPTHLQKKRLEHLIHAALSSVLGLRKKFAGIRIKSSQSLSLLDIAPTIFHSMYFQDILARMQLAPLISSALSNLTSIQSPILRQKVLDLQLQQITQPHEILEAVQRPITSLILRSTAVPSIAVHGKRIKDVTKPPRVGMIVDDQVHGSDGTLTSCYESVTDDIDICDQWISKEVHEDGSNALSDSQSDDNIATFDLGSVAWDPIGDHSSCVESDSELRDLDEHNNAMVLDTVIQYYDAEIGSTDEQPYNADGDKYPAKVTTPYTITDIFAHDSQEEPPDFKNIYEENFSQDLDMKSLADDYRPGDVCLVTAKEGTGPLVLEHASSGACETLRGYSGHRYGHNNSSMASLYREVNGVDINEKKNMQSINDQFSGIPSHDDMKIMWHSSAIRENENNLGHNLIDEGCEAAERNFEYPAHIGVEGDMTYNPELIYNDEGMYAPDCNYLLEDALQQSPDRLNIPRGFVRVCADNPATFEYHCPGIFGMDSDDNGNNLSYDNETEDAITETGIY